MTAVSIDSPSTSRFENTARYTVKLCRNQGVGTALVVGVATSEIQDDVIAYIGTKGGELIGDWYQFDENDDINDVSYKAKKLDRKALTYEVDGGLDIEQAGKYAVLFYHTLGPYKLTASHLEKEKEEIESYISNLKNAEKLADWYWVNTGDIDTIIKYTRKREIQGITFDIRQR